MVMNIARGHRGSDDDVEEDFRASRWDFYAFLLSSHPFAPVVKTLKIIAEAVDRQENKQPIGGASHRDWGSLKYII